MMDTPFHERRRQQFLLENYFQVIRRHYETSEIFWSSNSPESESPEQARSLAAASVAEDLYRLLVLRYTGGEPIETLRSELTTVIAAYERYQAALAEHEQIPEAAPLGMQGQLGDYERCMQLVGLCYLLHRRDLLPRIAALQAPYDGEDTLYEDLLSYAIKGRTDVDWLYHPDTYRPLIAAIYGDSNEEAIEALQEYVQGWYASFKFVPWHDGHKRIHGTDGDYFGYWAFEAGAVALLCDIDDSTITHLVYPKDMVAWAKANKHLTPNDSGDANANLRCVAGEACPREGWWSTPAKTNSHRRFKQGEVMPDVGGDYGATIWQWDQTQG